MNGLFTKPQREVYEVVLDAQRACIDACIADSKTTMKHINDICRARLQDGLKQLGIVPHSEDPSSHEHAYLLNSLCMYIVVLCVMYLLCVSLLIGCRKRNGGGSIAGGF